MLFLTAPLNLHTPPNSHHEIKYKNNKQEEEQEQEQQQQQ